MKSKILLCLILTLGVGAAISKNSAALNALVLTGGGVGPDNLYTDGKMGTPYDLAPEYDNSVVAWTITNNTGCFLEYDLWVDGPVNGGPTLGGPKKIKNFLSSAIGSFDSHNYGDFRALFSPDILNFINYTALTIYLNGSSMGVSVGEGSHRVDTGEGLPCTCVIVVINSASRTITINPC